MLYGDEAVLTASGVRMAQKPLELIGINHDSSCWGAWVPNWNPEVDPKAYPDHLLISPFHPETWHCLLHITLKLEDEEGTAADAFDALNHAGVDLLSHHMTPSGHHHATLHVVGTLPEVLARPEARDWQQRSRVDRDYNSENVKKAAAHLIAQPVLEAARQVHDQIVDRNQRQSFLRHGFLTTDPKGKLESVGGFVFNPKDIVGDVASWAVGQSIPTISVRWLQYPAFFWLYGDTGNVMQFDCGDGTEYLKVISESRRVYADGLLRVSSGGKDAEHYQARSIVCVDSEAHYARIMPNRLIDGEPCLLWVNYDTDVAMSRMDEDAPNYTARGLISRLATTIRQSGGNLWHTSNQVLQASNGRERAKIRFWITRSRTRANELSSGAVWADKIADNIKDLGKDQGWPPQARIISSEAHPVTAFSVFISTKENWWLRESSGGRVRGQVLNELHRLGIKPELSIGHETDREGGPWRDAIAKIKRATGFIQIVPKDHCRVPEAIRPWLTFELGVANSLSLPVVLLCEDDGNDVPAWKTAYQGMAHDLYIDSFNLRGTDEQIAESVRCAIAELDRKIREARSP